MHTSNKLKWAGLLILLAVTPILSNCAFNEVTPCDDVLLDGAPGSARPRDTGATGGQGGAYDDSGLRDRIDDLERRLAAAERRADSAMGTADKALKCCRKEYAILVTEHIYFDFNRTDIRPGDALILDKVADRMKQDPELIAEMSGFADAVGASDYNLALGQRRAESARDYLVNKGISSGRFAMRTFGESAAVHPPEADVKTREADRRVTIDILGYNTE